MKWSEGVLAGHTAHFQCLSCLSENVSCGRPEPDYLPGLVLDLMPYKSFQAFNRHFLKNKGSFKKLLRIVLAMSVIF